MIVSRFVNEESEGGKRTSAGEGTEASQKTEWQGVHNIYNW